jgi:intein/homing endonuclease
LDNNTELKITNDHPIYTNNGWAALDIELTRQKYDINVVQLEVGDIVKTYIDDAKVLSIEIIQEPTMTFTLKDVEDNANFYANGVLVHNRPFYCFIGGTQITMADGSFKNIEDVQIGDEVISLNEETKLNEVKKVIDTKSPMHNDLVKYTLSNGIEITSTFDHPYYVNKMELASFKPTLTNERYQLNTNVRKIQKGDCVYMIPKSGIGMHAVAIEKIEAQPLVDTQTYIFTVEDNHNFYANGILVHNK